MQKNFVLFMVTCVVIIISWVWVQHQLWPPRRPDLAKKAPDAKEPLKKPPQQVWGVNLAANRLGVQNPLVETAQLAWDLQRAAELFPAQVAQEKPAVKPEVKKVEEPALPVEQYTIGSKDTHVQAVLTTKGAGVQKLVLNHFEAADYLGLPTGDPLELIPDDPFQPSFLMFHYGSAKDDRPLQTLGDRVWQFVGQNKHEGSEEIIFSTRVPGQEHIKITKTYRLQAKDYHLTLLLEFERDGKAVGAAAQPLRYQLTGAHGLPIEGEWYTAVFRNALIGMVDSRGGFWRTMEDSFRISHKQGGDRVPEGERQESWLQYAAVATQYFAVGIVVDNLQPDKHAGGIDRRKILAWARPTHESTEIRGRIKLMRDNAILLGEGDKAEKIQPYELLPHVKRHLEATRLKENDKVVLSYYQLPDGTRVATWVRRGETPRPFVEDITVRVVSEPIDLAPGEKIAHQLMLYTGPVKTRLLGQFSGEQAVPGELVDRYADTLWLRTLTDWASPGAISRFFQAIGWTSLLIWTTSLMHHLLHWLSFAGYGLSIVLLTVVVRSAMFPISKKQALFSLRMQELAPEMKKISEKYKNDPQGKMEATRQLYRKHRINPMGGCLPLLLQLPIFMGLYYALQESIHFRLASFLWIDSLAAPDMLLWWSESIPVISSPDNQSHTPTGILDMIFSIFYLGPYLNVLPIAAVTFMFFQQKLMMPPPTDEQQAMQQKVMQYMMIFMGLMFYRVAAGLCIYFIATSAWGLAERKLLPKKKSAPAPLTSGKASSKPKPEPNGDGTVAKVKNWWAKILEEAKKK
jgi:YidC/Oxa1 family membrane protein insertase